jgi:hypothetical protein
VTCAEALETVRRLCGAYPDVGERPSHGAPTFFIGGKRSFLAKRKERQSAEHSE